MENKKSELLIIIPAYNEAANIGRVVEELKAQYPQYDYIVVNDGSLDRTAEICRMNQYALLDLPVNVGLSAAVLCGMRYAVRNHYRMAIQYDGDGQHCPEYIPVLIQQIEAGADIAIGSRFVNEKKPINARMLGSRVLSFLIRMKTGEMIHDPTSGMRAYSHEIMKQFVSSVNYRPEPDTISYLMQKGAVVKECQVQMRERTAGDSYLSTMRSLRYMVQMAFSILLVQGFRENRTRTEQEAVHRE